jgi:hypothetical protein
MISVLVLGIGLLGAGAPEETSPDADRAVYEAARDKIGRDPEAHVRLALWCERHGLQAERLKHLTLAVLNDPKNATARGLLGMVDFRGRWKDPESVIANVKSDEELTAKLAEYNARRARMAETADAHWRLALWCEEVGLEPEARAHLATVTRLDPSREPAWKRLGFKKQGGRWVTDAQLAAEKAEAEAQKQANQSWAPLLTKWRGWLHEKGKKEEAEAALSGVIDPRAVPAVWAVFASGDAAFQAKAVQVLGQIDATQASRALALLAVSERSAEVRRTATETLRRRDPREFVGLLIGLIRDPFKYEVRPVNGPTMPGELFVEGKRYNVRQVFGLNQQQISNLLRNIPRRIFDSSVPFDPFSFDNLSRAMDSYGDPSRSGSASVRIDSVAARRDVQIAQAMASVQQIVNVSQQQLDNSVQAVETMNAEIRQVNARTLPVLTEVTGQDLGESSEAWQAWWTDQRGYAYKSATPENKPTYTTFVENPYVPVHNACFAAGTPVQTLGGSRPIESIRIGDRVLTQDPKTGGLSFVPVVAVFHNEPAPTLRLTLGEETIVATGIHRFWKAGEGWMMARDLKTGDALRRLSGVSSVTSVESDRVQPVFNLQVAEGVSFFVGQQGMLVHDNSLVQPVPKPFDAAPELAAAITGATVERD